MLSSHSLCGLPLLFVSSILPNISSFIFLLLCILHMWPNSPSFLPISFCMIAVFDHINRRSLLSVSILFLAFSCSTFSQKPLFFFQFPSSPPILHIHNSRILKTHVCSTLFFVSISIDLLFQTFSMAFSAAVVFASLVRTSLMLSRSYVMLLPRYVNCLTFSKCLLSINNFPVGSFSPNTIVFVFSKFMLNPYLLPSSFSARVVSASLWASSSIRSISSANARLLILVPLIFTPPSLSLILSGILSNTSMKVFGDIGSPCLVPLLVANHPPSSFSILTAAVAFPFISLSSRVNFLSTPYESIAAHVMF